MSNIIDFPQDRGGHTGSVPDRSAERAERAEALRAVLELNRSMAQADQELVAEGVWKVLERLKAQGITAAQVLQKAGLAKKEDSTKWLSQYALNPDRLRNGRKTPRLNKRPRQYVRILETAAELSNTGQDDVLLEVFDSTTLTVSGNVPVAGTEYDELTRWLRDISKAVAAKHHLNSYFQDVARSGNQLLVVNGAEESSWKRLAPSEIKLAFSGDRFQLDWPISLGDSTTDAEHHEHDHNHPIPPYPSVLLGEWPIGSECEFGWDIADDSSQREKVSSYYKAELRWCIVPVGPDLHPEPALRVKISLSLPELSVKDKQGNLHVLAIRGLETLPSKQPTGFIANIVSGSNSIWCRLWRDGHDLPPLINKYFPPSWLDYRASCRFFPLTAVVIKDWFSLPAYDLGLHGWHFSDVPLHIRALGEPLFRTISADDFSPFPAGTIAAGLDHCLSGKHDADLLELLDTRAGHLVKLFHEASGAARADRSRGLAQLGSRLRRMRDHEPSSG